MSVSFHSQHSFKESLQGSNAFYNQLTYLKDTEKSFSEAAPVPVVYTWNTESKISSIAKQVFTVIFFPVGIYKILHTLAGIHILGASFPRPQDVKDIKRAWSDIRLDGEWKYKRISVEVDGYKIDATIMGKASTLGNGKWLLNSNGNYEFMGHKLHDDCLKEMLINLDSNALVFDYPSVQKSTGLPNREVLAKAHRAMMDFLEDKKNGIGAKQIVGYGHSLGGGVQADALRTHTLKEDVSYVFVKSRTFSNLSAKASFFAKLSLLGFFVKIIGWNIDSVASSKKLKAPEIILQTARVSSYQEIENASQIIDDEVIGKEASLATGLLKSSGYTKKNKLIIGIPEKHNNPLTDVTFLTRKINDMLAG